MDVRLEVDDAGVDEIDPVHRVRRLEVLLEGVAGHQLAASVAVTLVAKAAVAGLAEGGPWCGVVVLADDVGEVGVDSRPTLGRRTVLTEGTLNLPTSTSAPSEFLVYTMTLASDAGAWSGWT